MTVNWNIWARLTVYVAVEYNILGSFPFHPVHNFHYYTFLLLRMILYHIFEVHEKRFCNNVYYYSFVRVIMHIITTLPILISWHQTIGNWYFFVNFDSIISNNKENYCILVHLTNRRHIWCGTLSAISSSLQ